MRRSRDGKPPNQQEKDKGKGNTSTSLPSPQKKATRKSVHTGLNDTTTTEKKKKQDKISCAKVSAHMGNITFEKDMPGANGGMELDILKTIILREDYIARLVEMSESDSPMALIGAMANTLDLLRITTVEVVEAIVQWRKRQQKYLPFKWNGINYLLKLPSDLDFFQQCDVMVNWLGFSMERNPFIMPDNLDRRQEEVSQLLFEPGNMEPFFEVGGIPVAPLRPARSPNSSSRQGKHKTPYETRILNDEELLPRQLTSAQANASSTPPARPKSTFVLPSQIGNLDLLRIREAEKIVLAEEELCGRYSRDLYGRIVPESVAKQQKKTAAIKQAHGESTREIISTEAPGENTQQPQAEVKPTKKMDKVAVSPAILHTDIIEVTKIKQAGILAPQTNTNMETRIRYPMQRSRGAKMEQELEKSKQMNIQLEYNVSMLWDLIYLDRNHISHLRALIESEENLGLNPEVNPSKPDMEKIVMLQRDIKTQMELFERKKLEIHRKQEAIETFKLAQKSSAEKQRQEELIRRRNMDEAALALERVKLVEIYSATQIQKIARGVSTRQMYKTIRIRYTVASTYIQSAIRGFLARRRVHRLYHRHKAAITIQRLIRGVLARNATRLERLLQKQQKAATKIQKTFRGKLGCERMRLYRMLCTSKQRMTTISNQLFEFEMVAMGKALCSYAKYPNSIYTIKPTYIVLGIVRMLEAICLSFYRPMHEVRWMEAGQYLRRATRLLRFLTTISSSAGRRTIELLKDAKSLIHAFQSDNNFCKEHIIASNLDAIENPTKLLLEWIQNLAIVSDTQSAFLPPTPVLTLDLTPYIDEDSAEDNKCALEDYHSERQFVPLELIQDCPKRPRPVLVILSRDLPGRATENIVNQISVMFPGLFLRINKPGPINLEPIQQAFDSGYSVLLDADIGMSLGQQRIFLGQFAIVLRAMRPVPLSILLQGSITNRSGIGLAPGSYGVYENNLNLMFDGEAKYNIQLAADGMHTLLSGRLNDEMNQVSLMDCPPLAMVIVMEATLILLTPQQRFVSPTNTTSTVTWRLSRRLLSVPNIFLSKLKAIDLNAIPYENAIVLKEYLDLPAWPLYNETSGTLLFRLALFVEAVTKYAGHMHDQGGAAYPITRSKPIPGLFSSVITIKDPSDEDNNTCNEYLAHITAAILQDVRVHRESVKIENRYHIITLYRDCHRVYVTCYDPVTSNLLKTEIPDTHMNTFLAPNSFEAAQNKQAPATPLDMYKRVVGFSSLVKPKGIDTKPVLELRPRSMRLKKLSQNVHGHFATIVVSEVALGHLRFDIHIHDTWNSGRLARTLHVEDNLLQQLKLDASEQLEFQAYESMNIDNLYKCVLDRVHIEASELSKPFIHKSFNRIQRTIHTPEEIRVRVRKHGGSGRLLFRKPLRLRPIHTIWIVSVFDFALNNSLRIEAYRSDTSEKRTINISACERRELLLQKKSQFSGKVVPLWLETITSRLSMNAQRFSLDLQLDAVGHYLLLYPDHAKLAKKPGVKVIISSILHTFSTESGLSMRFYFPESSITHQILLHDAQISSAISEPWPSASVLDRQKAIRALYSLCVYDTDKKKVRITMSAGFYEESTQISPLPQSEVIIKKVESIIDTLPRDIHAIDPNLLQNTLRMLDGIVDNLVFLYDIPCLAHSSSFRCKGMLVRVDMFMTAYLKHVVEPNKPGLPDIHKEADWFRIKLCIYHPESSKHCEISIDGMRELREVIGPDEQKLISTTTVSELLRHIMTNRSDLSLKDDALCVSFLRSRLFTHHKITPINSSMDEDTFANEHKLIDHVDNRGVKLYSKVKHLRQHAVICTVFDITPPTDLRSESLILRIDGYIASISQKLTMTITGAQLREAIGSQIELLEASKAHDLAAHLVELVDAEIHGDTVYRLFIKEVIVYTSRRSSSSHESYSGPTPCLFKTIRTIAEQRILIGIFDTRISTPSTPLRVDFYQPSTSLSTSFYISLENLLKYITNGVHWEPEVLDKVTIKSQMHQILSYLCVLQQELECGTSLFVEWQLPSSVK
ncbi:hypothetical protein THRCLA_04807 [Thraustotheca clavata]|uniref:Uncharacterized protein n=1 Tax=Thraustotheca clavata TaxID=74557 RepID=A0A1V9ZY15_9STRA|nr:hypothetical protein THRCLA_04807 [Thraustotheca clavata]